MTTLTPLPAHPATTTDASRLRDEDRQRCEVWTRVMGYHRPVSSFNIGKRGEFLQRTPFEDSFGARRA